MVSTQLHGLQGLRPLRLGLCAAVRLQVKVRDLGLGLLRPRLNTGSVCDDRTTEIGTCGKSGAIQVNFYVCHYMLLVTARNNDNDDDVSH